MDTQHTKSNEEIAKDIIEHGVDVRRAAGEIHAGILESLKKMNVLIGVPAANEAAMFLTTASLWMDIVMHNVSNIAKADEKKEEDNVVKFPAN